MLGLKDERRKSLIAIWNNGNSEDEDEDLFASQMKEWLMNCERESLPEIDY